MAATLTVRGALDHPFDLLDVSGRLHAKGLDLADLYHLTGVALPTTPPYDLGAGFSRHGARYDLRQIVGHNSRNDFAGGREEGLFRLEFLLGVVPEDDALPFLLEQAVQAGGDLVCVHNTS